MVIMLPAFGRSIPFLVQFTSGEGQPASTHFIVNVVFSATDLFSRLRSTFGRTEKKKKAFIISIADDQTDPDSEFRCHLKFSVSSKIAANEKYHPC